MMPYGMGMPGMTPAVQMGAQYGMGVMPVPGVMPGMVMPGAVYPGMVMPGTVYPGVYPMSSDPYYQPW